MASSYRVFLPCGCNVIYAVEGNLPMKISLCHPPGGYHSSRKS